MKFDDGSGSDKQTKVLKTEKYFDKARLKKNYLYLKLVWSSVSEVGVGV